MGAARIVTRARARLNPFSEMTCNDLDLLSSRWSLRPPNVPFSRNRGARSKPLLSVAMASWVVLPLDGDSRHQGSLPQEKNVCARLTQRFSHWGVPAAVGRGAAHLAKMGY